MSHLDYVKMNVCSICSELILDKKFDTLDEIKKGMIEVILPGLNIPDQSIVITCAKCMESLQRCFNFKSNCMENEDYLQSFLTCDKFKVDLEDVVVFKAPKNMRRDEIFVKSEKKICRLCFVIIYNAEFTELYMMETNQDLCVAVKKCLPDMNLDLTDFPVCCLECVKSLRHLFQFIQNCSNMQNSSHNHVYLRETVPLIKEENNTQIAIKMEPTNKVENTSCSSNVNVNSNIDEDNVKHKTKNKPKKFPDETHQKEMKTFVCPNCSYETKKRSHFNRHKRTHNRDSSRMHHCTYCEYKTHDRSNLIAHTRIHSNRLPYNCDICGKSFNQKNKLDGHILKKHNISDFNLGAIITSKVHECKICDYKTVNSTHLSQHMLKHDKSAATKFKCEYCQYNTHDKSNLKAHSQKHINPKPYVCCGCGKRFDRKQDLDSHILSKHGENCEMLKTISSKIHLCFMCSYRTVNKYHLSKHIKTHK